MGFLLQTEQTLISVISSESGRNMNFSRPHIWEIQKDTKRLQWKCKKRRPWNQKEKERRRRGPLQEQLEKEKPLDCCAGCLCCSPQSPCRCWVCWWVVTCWLMAQVMNYRLQLALASDLQVGALPKSGVLQWPQMQCRCTWHEEVDEIYLSRGVRYAVFPRTDSASLFLSRLDTALSFSRFIKHIRKEVSTIPYILGTEKTGHRWTKLLRTPRKCLARPGIEASSTLVPTWGFATTLSILARHL